jgi:glycerol-3-phosphate acyltransferase PlsY
MIPIIIFIVIAYLCGSLSSAVIVCKLLKLPDPRKEGSGNPGTANVLRVAGKKAAILVFLGDVLKGCIPVLLARIFIVQGFGLGLVALAAVIGHIYPIFFKFKGGKGVATFGGTTVALSFTAGVAFGLAWLIIAVIFRYASLASLIGSLLSLIYLTIFVKISYFFPILAIVLLIIWKHKSNIERLKAGTERKIKLFR